MSDLVVEKIVRPERKLSGSWLEVIASNLDYHRATFLWKCEGLSETQLRQRPLPSSELTLLGLMRHLQGVERYWFQRRLAAGSERARQVFRVQKPEDKQAER